MDRLENWQSNLSQLIETKRNEPADIVTFNCLMWACLAAKAVNGSDHYSKFEGRFKTEAGAAKILRQIGKANSSVEYLESVLGDKKPLAFVRRGDIVVPSNDLGLPSDFELFGPAPGVCYGSVSFFVGETGLLQFDTASLGFDSYGFSC